MLQLNQNVSKAPPNGLLHPPTDHPSGHRFVAAACELEFTAVSAGVVVLIQTIALPVLDLPVTKTVQQLPGNIGRERFLGEPSESEHSRLHLLEVGTTSRAHGHVKLEAQPPPSDMRPSR